jgi:secondary thiamine-phosphate synthase enzyme
MRQAIGQLTIETSGKGLIAITGAVEGWVTAQEIGTGLLTLWCRHTSASLIVQENADPDVRADIARFFDALVPEDPARYAHGAEGPDDMPAHLRTLLTQTQLTIPLQDGRPMLGTWQGLYLFEHRRGPQRRQIALHVIGE